MIKYIKVKIFKYRMTKAVYEAIPFLDDVFKSFVLISRHIEEDKKTGEDLYKDLICAIADAVHNDKQIQKDKVKAQKKNKKKENQ